MLTPKHGMIPISLQKQKFLSKEEADKVLKRMKANRALKNKDIPTYEKLVLELYKDISATSSEELNSLAWNFFENVDNKASLDKAVAWAQESVKKIRTMPIQIL